MRISFACDHAAYAIKDAVIGSMKQAGHEVIDFGCTSLQSCDYPDHAIPAARAVAEKSVDRGVLICGTGIGMSIVANKVPGVRAALVTNNEVAKLTREHNDSNVVCFPARFASVDQIIQWLATWLATPFSNDVRHINRLEKITALENMPRS